MCVAVLVETGGSGHSLPKSFYPHKFIDKFSSLPIVKKCVLSRHCRGAHESRSYGFFVSPTEILESDLEKWLSDATTFVCAIGREKKNKIGVRYLYFQVLLISIINLWE